MPSISLAVEAAEKAKQVVAQVLEEGKSQLSIEKKSMIESARKEMAEIAIAAARKIINKKIDDKSSNILAEEAIRELIP